MRGPSRGDVHGYRPLSPQAAADLNAWFIDCYFSLILIHCRGDEEGDVGSLGLVRTRRVQKHSRKITPKWWVTQKRGGALTGRWGSACNLTLKITLISFFIIFLNLAASQKYLLKVEKIYPWDYHHSDKCTWLTWKRASSKPKWPLIHKFPCSRLFLKDYQFCFTLRLLLFSKPHWSNFLLRKVLTLVAWSEPKTCNNQ